MKMMFGKYSGTPVEELPQRYVRWLLANNVVKNEQLRKALSATVAGLDDVYRRFANYPSLLSDFLIYIGWQHKSKPNGNGFDGVCPLCNQWLTVKYDVNSHNLPVWVFCVDNDCFRKHDYYNSSLAGLIAAQTERKYTDVPDIIAQFLGEDVK